MCFIGGGGCVVREKNEEMNHGECVSFSLMCSGGVLY